MPRKHQRPSCFKKYHSCLSAAVSNQGQNRPFVTSRRLLSNSIESGPRIGVQKVPLLAGRNDSARPRRSWSGLRSRGERGGVGGGFER